MASREYVVVGDYEELLCVQLSTAEAYWTEVEKRFGNAWLLDVTSTTHGAGRDSGIDLGFPWGGFSLLETELIIQGLPGPPLNKWGLIDQRADALAFMEQRTINEALEQLDGVESLAVRVVRPKGWRTVSEGERTHSP